MPRVLKRAEAVSSPESPSPRRAEAKVGVSLQLPHSLIIRLEAVARKEKTQRNVFLEKLLDQGLRKYAFDGAIRLALGESQVPDGEVA